MPNRVPGEIDAPLEVSATKRNPDKHVLVIGAGTFQKALIRRCSEFCGVLVAAPVVSDDLLPFIEDKVIADVRDFEPIMEFARGANITGRPVDGVLTDQTDIPVLTVARIAEELELPGIGHETARLFTDKSLMRDKMDELGIKTLPHRTVHSLNEALEAFEDIGSPVIIKPVDAQGSRGVQVCHTPEDLKAKYDEAQRWASRASGHAVLVERYIDNGREFVVEGMALGGEFWNLCIGDTLYFDIEDSLSAKERTFPTIADDALRDRVLDLNTRIVTGFGLNQGLTHSEFIMDGDDIYLIETAARGGGAFISSDLIPLSCGLDTAAFLMGIADGTIRTRENLSGKLGMEHLNSPDATAQHPVQHCGYLAFYIPQGTIQEVRGIQEVRDLPYVHDNQLGGIEKLLGTLVTGDHTDKTTRYLVTLCAPTRAELEERMAFVRNTIQMDIVQADGSTIGLIWE